MRINNQFYINGFALSLVFKQRFQFVCPSYITITINPRKTKMVCMGKKTALLNLNHIVVIKTLIKKDYQSIMFLNLLLRGKTQIKRDEYLMSKKRSVSM